MKTRLMASVFAALFLAPAAATAQLPLEAAGAAADGMPTLAPLLERVTPAVVNVSVQWDSASPDRNSSLEEFRDFEDFFRRYFGQPERGPNSSPRRPRPRAAGSGVIVDAERGHVITNAHVIDDAETVTVTLTDGRQLDAEILGSDPATDVALLKVDAEDLAEVPIGDSETLRVGDFVLAIGNPFGLGQTVTSGIVSALGRSGIIPQGYEDFIQTDASINPGNSGGALINLRGELIGINSAIFTTGAGNIGIGFAIPTAMALPVVEQLDEFGSVRRGLLGVQIRDLTPDLVEALSLKISQGAVVTQVTPDSAAEAVGIEAGEIITEVNGETVEGASDLRQRIGMMRAGDTVDVTVMNETGNERTVTATLGELVTGDVNAAGRETPRSEALEGARLSELREGLPGYGEIEGVAVVSVDEGSPAAAVGLRVGDVVTAVNRQRVSSLDEVQEQVDNAGDVIALTIWRDGQKLFLILPN